MLRKSEIFLKYFMMLLQGTSFLRSIMTFIIFLWAAASGTLCVYGWFSRCQLIILKDRKMLMSCSCCRRKHRRSLSQAHTQHTRAMGHRRYRRRYETGRFKYQLSPAPALIADVLPRCKCVVNYVWCVRTCCVYCPTSSRASFPGTAAVFTLCWWH